MTNLRGVIPILATPFHPDEALDLQSWERLLEFTLGLGVDGITILGVLGESNRLTDREREALIQSAVAAVKKRVPIIVGTSHTGTEAARYLARMAQDLGGDAVMVTPAREGAPSDDRIVETYQQIADGLAIPIVLQDHPASTEVHMSVPLMLRLVREVPSIQCIKEEAVPTAPKIRQLRSGLGERPLPILTGQVMKAMIKAGSAGDWQRVHDLYARFAPLIVFEQQPGVAIRKELLRRRGLFSSARARHPGATITPPAAAQLESLLMRTLPGVDITRPITAEVDVASSR